MYVDGRYCIQFEKAAEICQKHKKNLSKAIGNTADK
jgi:hypothetical protein